MAFAYTKDWISIFGTKKVSGGTWTNGAADTGGDIQTGLNRVDSMFLTVKATTSAATAPAVDETLPLSGGAVTIVSAADQDGTWMAVGI